MSNFDKFVHYVNPKSVFWCEENNSCLFSVREREKFPNKRFIVTHLGLRVVNFYFAVDVLFKIFTIILHKHHLIEHIWFLLLCRVFFKDLAIKTKWCKGRLLVYTAFLHWMSTSQKFLLIDTIIRYYIFHYYFMILMILLWSYNDLIIIISIWYDMISIILFISYKETIVWIMWSKINKKYKMN